MYYKFLYKIFCSLLLFLALQTHAQQTSSPGIKMVFIPAGTFSMGSKRGGEDADESPVHTVTVSKSFLIAATEITNKQYEAFDPLHKRLRGKNGFSTEDDEAVIFVSYDEVTAFCNWLSQKEGKPYRLPTEAEWEYACRAGTTTEFYTGDTLPLMYYKIQQTNRVPKPVSLRVAQTPANAHGLYDMHGNVEEWCYDWYGTYSSSSQTDPVGYADGLYRVTRGGSHNTRVYCLRSANRMAMLPQDKHWLTGFRVVQAEMPLTKPLVVEQNKAASKIAQQKFIWNSLANKKPFFAEPVPYVIEPATNNKVPFYKHNHCPAITWLPNGDVLAIWFSTSEEHGREMAILQSRLHAGKKSWDMASFFFKVPDRNMTGSSLFYDKKGTIYHLNGVEAAGDWQNLAIVMRISKDNGATWAKPILAQPEHAMRHQVIAGIFQTKEGWLVQPCDAVPGPYGGTVLQISKDKGKHWEATYAKPDTPIFKNGNTGGLIAGIHAGVVQLKNGSLLALGRNDNIKNADSILQMPMSISKDMGKSWQYFPSAFPPIESGQRLVLMRLNEGALLLVSFTHSPGTTVGEGMWFNGAAGKMFRGYGMYASLSFDEGKTWPIKKLITDGQTRLLNGGAWTKDFQMDTTHAEPKGYLAATQTPDNAIHLLSSNLYYRFNLAWLQQ